MNCGVTKSKIISSLFWKLLERSGTQGIQFVVMLILARLVLPEEFGLIVLILTFVTLANVLTQSGLTTALIQKKKVDEIDYISVFYLSLINASFLYLLLFFTAPLIASFFNQQEITLILRVLAITLFFGVLNSIQNVIIARNMQFEKLVFSSLISISLSGTIGIILAFNSYGVWALVFQQLINQFLITLILWFTVRWRPKLLFSFQRIRVLFSFGWKLMISSLIDSFESNLRNLLIGKIYTPSMMGFYNRGENIPNMLVTNINGAIQAVLFPILSSSQDDSAVVKDIVRRSITISSFIIFPMMVGVAVIAEPLILLLLTDKWLAAVPFMQILCAAYALWPIHTANLQAINALGRSDIFLKLEIIKSIVSVVILVITIPIGIYAMAMGVFVSSVIGSFINSFPNLKLLNYSFLEQWKDISPSLFISLIMGLIVYMVQWIELNTLLTLCIQIVVGVMLYVGLAKMFKLESFTYLLLIFKDLLNSKKVRN